MKLLAVTACLTGVAHTYLAAEALERAAKARGIEIKIETQGAMGLSNKITTADVREADAVILTKDVGIKEKERFYGKIIVNVSANDAVRKANQIIRNVEAFVKSKKNEKVEEKPPAK